MKNEYLNLLNSKFANLTEEEQKKREAYLKSLSNGEILGPPTYYPSIDIPQLKYYRDELVKDVNVNQTIYDLIFKDCDLTAPAIGYLGIEWTYGQLKQKVDKLIDSFTKIGIKYMDTVLVGIANYPEGIASLIALDTIGAIFKIFDLRSSKNTILDYAKNSNCKYMISSDFLLPTIEEIINETNLQKVIAITSFDSFPESIKFAMKDKIVPLPNDERFISICDLIEMGNENSNIEHIKFDKNRPSIMIQSSGTTGKAKTIVHSDYSATSGAKGLSHSDLPVEPGKVVFVALPLWIAYGLGNAVIFSLAMGAKVELAPDFEPDVIYKNIDKFTMSFGAPFHYRYLKNNFSSLSKEQQEISRQKDCYVTGGDKVSVQELKEFEEMFNAPLINGYGCNEGWGALTANPLKGNRHGSVGIPKYGETIIIYDSENDCELPYGEVGEIWCRAETQFLYYENNPEKTNEIKQTHYNSTYINTGDYGYIDKDGFVYVEGRKERVITRLGFKISAYTIEDKITEHPAVKECVTIAVEDKDEEHVPMSYIVLKDEFKSNTDLIKADIEDKCVSELKQNEIPKYFRIVDALPYTSNSKYDFRLLEKKGNEYVHSLENDHESKILLKK